MKKKGMTVQDLPSLLDIDLMYQKHIELLSKQCPNPTEVLEQKIKVTQMFIFQNYDLIEPQDTKFSKSLIEKFARYFLLSVVSSSAINIAIGRFHNGYIYKLPTPIRVAFRLSLFAVPLGKLFTYYYDIYLRSSNYMSIKYMDRVEMFFKTGDKGFLNPSLET